tara:strand:+ start:1294 stop:1632 length:339 start_codon:yes stop_codon:yes gene_type:complete
LSLEIGSWNVSNVDSNLSLDYDGFYNMFNGATAFNQDISSWNLGNATSIREMFTGATSFNQDISSWDVSNIVNMDIVFTNITSFNQDLSSWDVSSVTNMSEMLTVPILLTKT